MRTYFFLILVLCSTAFAADPLFVRRIKQLCSDGQWELAKSQIYAHLETLKESSEGDELLTILGDFALKEKQYLEALEAYEALTTTEAKRQVRGKRWYTLYQCGQFSRLHDEIEPCLSWIDEEGRFYFAESCFRRALAVLKDDKEAAKALCEEALPHYEAVEERFAAPVAMACAEIYRIVGRQEEAVARYRRLAREPGELTPQARLHATIMLAQYAPLEASPLLEAMAKEGIPEATAAWFHVLVHTDRWKTIIQEKELLHAHLPKEKLPLFHYALGKTLMDARDYHGALEALLPCLKTPLPSPYDHRALTLLVLCSRECGDLETLERAYEDCVSRYGEDVKLCKIKALAYRDAGQPKRALEVMQSSGAALPEECGHLEIMIALEEGNHEALAALIEKRLAKPFQEKDEEKGLRLLLAKTYLSLGRQHTAKLHLKEHQQTYGPCAESHALLAQCGGNEVIVHAEEALRLDPSLESMHLHLFNAYLARGDEEKAAQHLHAIIHSCEVPPENRLWLAQFRQKQGSGAQELISLLEPMRACAQVHEPAMIFLAELYEARGENKAAAAVLEPLRTSKALLVKAELLAQQGEINAALPPLAQLEKDADQSVALKAKLILARLLFDQLPPQARKRRHPEAVGVLRRLEDLKLCKRLATEPIHFEAALDFAAFRAQLAGAPQQDAVYLKELQAVREEFTLEDDLASRDYHAARKAMPEKEALYQAYLRYLDALIYLTEGKIATQGGNATLGEAKERAAYALLVSLSSGNGGSTKYLVEKAASALYCKPS